MPDSLDSSFNCFWAAYPRKAGKGNARKSWQKIDPDADLVQRMLTTLAWQKRTPTWRAGYVPHPATWLNQARWEDEPFEPESALATSRPTTKETARQAHNRDVFARALARHTGRG